MSLDSEDINNMKRCWIVTTPGYAPFQMVSLEGEIDHAKALRDARVIWPNCWVV